MTPSVPTFIRGRDVSPILAAARQWADTCVVHDGSLFDADPVWTAAGLAEFTRAFVENPDDGKASFHEKLRKQLQACTGPTRLLAAELLWALWLFPTNIGEAKKRQQIDELRRWAGGGAVDEHPLLADTVLAGIGGAGTAFNTHVWRELQHLLALVAFAKSRPTPERQRMVSNYDAFLDWIDAVPTEGKRQVPHVLRYLLFPARVEPMASNNDRRTILDRFGVAPENATRQWTDRQLDDAMLTLRQRTRASRRRARLLP